MKITFTGLLINQELSIRKVKKNHFLKIVVQENAFHENRCWQLKTNKIVRQNISSDLSLY